MADISNNGIVVSRTSAALTTMPNVIHTGWNMLYRDTAALNDVKRAEVTPTSLDM